MDAMTQTALRERAAVKWGGGWTDERTDRLKQLWEEGLSCSIIAAELGGVTRNAVIGKVHRLGLALRGRAPAKRLPAGRRPTRVKRPTRSPWKPAKVEIEETAAVAFQPIVDVDIPVEQRKCHHELTGDTCRWPVGDPGSPEFFFCGGTIRAGHPYCHAHCARAYGRSPGPIRWAAFNFSTPTPAAQAARGAWREADARAREFDASEG